MMKGGFADEQMIGFLRQAEAGMSNKELRRCNDFSDATFYKWRVKYTELVSYSFIIQGYLKLTEQFFQIPLDKYLLKAWNKEQEFWETQRVRADHVTNQNIFLLSPQ